MYTKDNVACVFLALFVAFAEGAKVKVAVYEHVVISPDDPEADFTRPEAFQWMSKNLKVFEKQARKAAEQNARIIVFPEYGITGFDHSRDSMIPFLEDIPDVDVNWNPCKDPARFQETLVLENLSCIAKANKIYIVANMGDIKKCDTKTDRACPMDGRFQFNTNVVFDDDGQLIARYHKRHMFDEEPLFDPAPMTEYVYFDTPFGQFGTVVCFDILHYNPTQVLLNNYGIKNLLVTSAWNVFVPFIIPLQMFSGVAKRNHVNVLASNIRNDLYKMSGSGIFGQDVQVFTPLNVTSKDGVLLVAEIQTDLQEREVSSEITPMGHGHKLEPNVNDTHIGTFNFGLQINYSPLKGQSGFVSTCQDSVCCSVEYTFKYRDDSEIIVLSAVDNLMEEPGVVHMQFCAVFKCSPGINGLCDGGEQFVTSVFSEIKIQAYVDKGAVFPIVSTVKNGAFGENTLDMEMENYQFDAKNAILYSNEFQHPLLAAVVYSTKSMEEYRIGASSGAAEKTALLCLILTLSLMVVS